MISDELLSHLRNYGIQILMVGDHGQLPPVGGAGSLMQHPDIRLEKIHRQAEHNPIIKLSAEIRRTGRFDRKLADGKHVSFVPMSGLNRLLTQRYRNLRGNALFDVITLCYTNQRRATVNQLCRSLIGFSGPPKIGEQVICLRNDRSVNVYNGMRGIVTRENGRHPSWPWQIRVEVDFVEDDIKTNVTMCAQQFGRARTFDDFSELEKAILETAHKEVQISSWQAVGGLYDFSYGATVHKFQGSGVKDVLLVVDRPGPVDEETWRRWKYTAVTRAIESITIVE
jgi:exodeoxyribonuclease-5